LVFSPVILNLIQGLSASQNELKNSLSGINTPTSYTKPILRLVTLMILLGSGSNGTEK
jgi:hypothetical protein